MVTKIQENLIAQTLFLKKIRYYLSGYYHKPIIELQLITEKDKKNQLSILSKNLNNLQIELQKNLSSLSNSFI